MAVQRGERRVGAVAAPERVDDRVAGDDLLGVEKQ